MVFGPSHSVSRGGTCNFSAPGECFDVEISSNIISDLTNYWLNTDYINPQFFFFFFFIKVEINDTR